MELKELNISGFKSIGEIKISNPNPFTVFVGPNASGKSNIFEALEFFALCNIMHSFDALKLFGNFSEIVNQANSSTSLRISVNLRGFDTHVIIAANPADIETLSKGVFGLVGSDNILHSDRMGPGKPFMGTELRFNSDYIHFFNFSRIFVGKSSLVKRNIQDDSKLNIDASNLEKVLKRILKDEAKREEILELLRLLVPGFSKVEIATEELSGNDNLLVYEESLNKPLRKNLISDGTFNILAIIAALYQSDEAQFLCIEEPENGLNPKVVKELVSIIRNICKEKGHFVWLNTHSQTLVSELTTEEIILVDKVNGLTQVKQIKGMDLHGLKMDEALLTNAIGGGIPW